MIEPYGPPPPPPVHVHPKSPAAAIGLSFLIPGLGSMYAGKAGAGTAILVAYVLGWVLTLVLVGFLVVPVAWIFGMVHAHGAAVQWNLARGIES